MDTPPTSTNQSSNEDVITDHVNLVEDKVIVGRQNLLKNEEQSPIRPQKNSRRTFNSFMTNTADIFDAPSQLIMDPSIDSPGTISERQTSHDGTLSSPGKCDESMEVCALCNCGSEMALILGQLTQYPVSPSTLRKLDKFKTDNCKDDVEDISSSDVLKRDTRERVFVKRRRRRPKVDFDSNLPPDMIIFGTAKLQEFTDIIDANGNLWAHHCCAAWSAGVCQTDSYDLENVDRAVAKALLKKCSHCQRFGASVECQVYRCNKLFHYPCCASAGAFQNITSMMLLCPDHLDRTEKLADADASCDHCGKTENLNLELFCTSCGRHFHSYCVDMTIPITPVVRMGWQCSHCKVCQGCKQPGDEDKMLCCDHCDKGYHTYCLNPPISVVPKSVWKCLSCRKCDDCGATRPGGGPSCRWHNNFTLCDRCYQQRKKGQCCPICNRAVRLYSNTDVLQCVKCFKCVHGECDPDGIDAEKYICCLCSKEGDLKCTQDETNDSISSYDLDLAATGQHQITLEEAELFSFAASADFLKIESSDHEENYGTKTDGADKYGVSDEKLSESTIGSPHSSFNNETFNEISNNNSYFPKRNSDILNRRLKKSCFSSERKSTCLESDSPKLVIEEFAQSSLESPDSTSLVKPYDIGSVDVDAVEDDDDDGDDDKEEGLHSTAVIVSTNDSYTLKQDICMCCGSFGKSKEGYLISCVQCGQCFHPFCVNVKVNEVILRRGWRCLDCTVCEGCGRNADEAHLLLCDICDISFHTYCLDPPLEEVPVGGWKCKWCAICEDCGSKEAGFGCTWMANYTQCGPCSSEQYCTICSYAYEPNNLVIQCEQCKRWLHAECDGLYTEEDTQLACTMLYNCSQCRPITKHLGIYSNLKNSIISKLTVRKALCNNIVSSTSTNTARKTRTLHNMKARKITKAALKEQKRAELDSLPLIPSGIVASIEGTVPVDLGLLKSRLQVEELIKERLLLTENGLKQIKSQVIRAPIQRAVRKERVSRKKEEVKTSAIMSEEISCSAETLDDNLQIERIENGEELESENNFLSPDVQVKQEEQELDLMPSDTIDETSMDGMNDDSLETQEPEDRTDPFDFFGVDLLEKHLHMELESLNAPDVKKKMKKEKKRERKIKKAAKLAEAAKMAFNATIGPSVPDPTAVITEPMRNCMSITQSSSLSIKPASENVFVFEKAKLEESMYISPSKNKPSLDDKCVLLASPNNISAMKLFDDQTNVKDNLEQMPLKKVTSGITMQETSHSSLPLTLTVTSGMPVIPSYSCKMADEISPMQVMNSNSPTLPMRKDNDAFETVFGADGLKAAREKDDFNSKIDTQKQLRKWELDEKLEENATISPVLYANMMHKKLKDEYKDWPNRGRAIARLWRKLPAEERQPFRHKARDNRVKLKEKKCANRELVKAQQRLLSGDQKHVDKVPSYVQTSPDMSSSSALSSKSFSAETDTSNVIDNVIPSTNPSQCSKEADFLKTDSQSILAVPEPPLLLSPSFSTSSMSGLPSPLSSSTSYQASVASPLESDLISTEGLIKTSLKIKSSNLKKDTKQSNKRMQVLLLQEQEKQWKLLQHQRQFEQERQAILKQQKSATAERGPIHPSARFSATLSSSVLDDLSLHTLKTLGKTVSPDNFPNRVPNVSSLPTSTPKKDNLGVSFLDTSMNDKALIQTENLTVPSNKNMAARFPNAVKTDKGENIETLETGSQSPDVMDTLLSRGNLDRNNHLRNAEQQQAYLLHQQYMAAQQQYIQWQLSQQSTTAESMYSQKSFSGKELPEVNSEEQHQERIRFLYQQRQFSKDSTTQLTQQPPTQASRQDVSEAGVPPPTIPSPSLEINSGNFPQVPRFSIPTSPEAAIYHQMFLEYMIKFRNNPEIDASSIPANQLYNNMMTEIAKQYYQRHASFSKLIHQHMSQSSHFPVPARSSLTEDVPGNVEEGTIYDSKSENKLDTSQGHQGSPLLLKSSSDSKTVDGALNNRSYSRVHSKAGPLPKSASFQISRIAADSTSNDDHDTEGILNDVSSGISNSSHQACSNENEITSSRISTSIDGSADLSEGLPESSSEGYNFNRDEDAEVSSATSKRYSQNIFQYGSNCKTTTNMKVEGIFTDSQENVMKNKNLSHELRMNNLKQLVSTKEPDSDIVRKDSFHGIYSPSIQKVTTSKRSCSQGIKKGVSPIDLRKEFSPTNIHKRFPPNVYSEELLPPNIRQEHQNSGKKSFTAQEDFSAGIFQKEFSPSTLKKHQYSPNTLRREFSPQNICKEFSPIHDDITHENDTIKQHTSIAHFKSGSDMNNANIEGDQLISSHQGHSGFQGDRTIIHMSSEDHENCEEKESFKSASHAVHDYGYQVQKHYIPSRLSENGSGILADKYSYGTEKQNLDHAGREKSTLIDSLYSETDDVLENEHKTNTSNRMFYGSDEDYYDNGNHKTLCASHNMCTEEDLDYERQTFVKDSTDESYSDTDEDISYPKSCEEKTFKRSFCQKFCCLSGEDTNFSSIEKKKLYVRKQNEVQSSQSIFESRMVIESHIDKLEGDFMFHSFDMTEDDDRIDFLENISFKRSFSKISKINSFRLLGSDDMNKNDTGVYRNMNENKQLDKKPAISQHQHLNDSAKSNFKELRNLMNCREIFLSGDEQNLNDTFDEYDGDDDEEEDEDDLEDLKEDGENMILNDTGLNLPNTNYALQSTDEYIGCLHGEEDSDECDGDCNHEEEEDEDLGGDAHGNELEGDEDQDEDQHSVEDKKKVTFGITNHKRKFIKGIETELSSTCESTDWAFPILSDGKCIDVLKKDTSRMSSEKNGISKFNSDELNSGHLKKIGNVTNLGSGKSSHSFSMHESPLLRNVQFSSFTCSPTTSTSDVLKYGELASFPSSTTPSNASSTIFSFHESSTTQSHASLSLVCSSVSFSTPKLFSGSPSSSETSYSTTSVMATSLSESLPITSLSSLPGASSPSRMSSLHRVSSSCGPQSLPGTPLASVSLQNETPILSGASSIPEAFTIPGPSQLPGVSPLSGISLLSSTSLPGTTVLSGISTLPGSSPHLVTSTLPGNSPSPKASVISLHPGSPRYLQIFIYQHQLLIMQFQQYQFQLQYQFQQLSQQQMSPQQQFLLQNQFHQQMMLLQQQFMQQQAQLHRMAVSGVQFSEHQLNAMYQQQMLTQQTYRQWVISLPAEQQMHLQQRMQASMQQVQLQMAQIIQHYSIAAAERKTSPAKASTKEDLKKKPIKSRRLAKKKNMTSEQLDFVSPKFPVPELSDQMKSHVQRSQVSSSHVQKIDSSLISSITCVSTTVTSHCSKTFAETKSVAQITPRVASVQTPVELDPIDKSKLFQKEILNNNAVLNQYKEIEKSFLRQQREMREVAAAAEKNCNVSSSYSDLHKKSSKTDTIVSISTLPKVPAEKFPTHPSHLLHRANSINISEKFLKLNAFEKCCATKETSKDVEFSDIPTSNSFYSQHIPIPVEDSILVFDSKSNDIKKNAENLILSNSNVYDAQNQINVNECASDGSHPITNNQKACVQSSFSVSDILRTTNDNKNGSTCNTLSDVQQSSDYCMSDFGIQKQKSECTNLLESEINEEKKNNQLVKNKKKEMINEKKRLKEIEKQKRLEERARIKLLKEQRKAEKLHHRMLKQKAVQDAKLAIKKKKVPQTLNVTESVTSECSTSPTVILTSPSPPTPKIPLCEPDVHLVYPLVQPAGYNANFKPVMAGEFGNCLLDGIKDFYMVKDEVEVYDGYRNMNQEVSNSQEITPSVLSNRSNNGFNNSFNFGCENTDSKEIELAYDEMEEDSIIRCNNCYCLLTSSVFYLDKKFVGVTECNLHIEELLLTDQLAFCSNECVDVFQQNLDFDIDNDDVELVDAVKTAFMATADHTTFFLSLQQQVTEDGNGNDMKNTKIRATIDKKHGGWKRWTFPSVNSIGKFKPKIQEDVDELMERYKVQIKPHEGIKDIRICYLCNGISDGETHTTSRLLNFNVDAWVHLNCALWSSEVYEAVNGGLHNFDKALFRSKSTKCSFCHKLGATINCSQTFGVQQRTHCEKTFHFLCAVQSQCGFYKDKTILCYHHKGFGDVSEELTSFVVHRKVYIERDITKQIARMLNLNNGLERREYTFRVGNLIFHELGQVPTNLLDSFSNKDFIYPIGFETTLIFWDHHTLDKRRYYTCSISERLNSPRFRVKVHPNDTEVSSYTSCTSKGAWDEIVRNRQSKRETGNLLKFFPEFLRGEDLFGLSEQSIQRMLESLPGIDTIQDYNFQYGRTPILIAELPLALNPTGCIRSEKVRKLHANRPFAIRMAHEHSQGQTMEQVLTEETWLTYSQRNAQMWSTKTGQYRRMRQEWRQNVVLGRSRIQGLGLFVKRDIEENTFLIEYIGSLIRHEVANRLEKLYERQNRGIYMFRIDNKYVVDATMTGGPARYINHSCFPNCVAEIVTIENKKRIIIISNQKIEKGAELTYDYKFEFEDDSSKIACLCGASNCRKWMN